MVKDNHIAACGSITQAVQRLRGDIPHTIRIEVETDILEQVKECLTCGVELSMLGNKSVEEMKEAVGLIDSSALVEA